VVRLNKEKYLYSHVFDKILAKTGGFIAGGAIRSSIECKDFRDI